MTDKLKNLLLSISASTLFLSIQPAIVFAAETEESNGVAHHLFWPLVNFLIVFITLYVFLKKPLKDFLQQRSNAIEKTLKEAKEAKLLAEKGLNEINLQVKITDNNIESILRMATEHGEREKQRLIEEGEAISAKIKETAKNNIELEVKKAVETIRKETVNAAMTLAEQNISAQLTPQQQQKIIEDAIEKIAHTN